MLFALLALPLASFQEEPSTPPPATEQAPGGQEEAAPLTPQTVVATVGEVELTYQALLAEVNRLLPLTTYHGNVPESEWFEFRDKALANLIERTLIHQDALRRGMPVSEEEARAELRKSIATAGVADRVDEKMFEEMLVQIRPVIEKRVLIDKNEARFATTVPAVTEEQMRAAFEAQRDHLRAPELIHVREILLSVQPGSTEEEALKVRDRAQEVLEGLQAGGDFATAAVVHSEHATGPSGGDRGWIQVGRMRARELNDALAKLEDGGLSGLIRTRWGYHIIQRVETQAPRAMSYEEVEEGLQRELQKRNEEEARKAWMEELRGRFAVVIRDVLPPAPEKTDAGAKESAGQPRGGHGG